MFSQSLRGKRVENLLLQDTERKLVEMGQSGFIANPPVARSSSLGYVYIYTYSETNIQR